MNDPNALVARLLGQAQAGHPDVALERAEAALHAYSGNVAGLHLVRYVSLNIAGDVPRAAAALDDMVTTAERERSPGWLACGLATRVSYTLRQFEIAGADFDLDRVLRDMVAAERVVGDEKLPIPAVNAHNAIALGYFDLRLYELAEPQFHAAYAISAAESDADGNCSMWLSNLAEVHLYWALELYQIGQGTAAEAHTAEAERISVRAAAEASGPEAETWRLYALLLAACAKADRHDPATAAHEIGDYLGQLADRGIQASFLAYCRPFQAVALRRSGRAGEARTVMEHAVAELPPDAGLLITSATLRTHALLLADDGLVDDGPAHAAGLRYGATLAAALWQQRRRTLHSVATLKSLESLQVQHDLAARAADVDALTGIANRRAFDAAVERARQGTGVVTVLLVDTDRFKEINDTRGHAAGDAVLQAIAKALAAQVRDSDVVARLGGDEFGALLPDVDPATAAAVANRMVQAVRDLSDCPVTLSIGVAGAPAHLLPETMAQADQAMYRAKRAGGDGVEQAQPQATVALTRSVSPSVTTTTESVPVT